MVSHRKAVDLRLEITLHGIHYISCYVSTLKFNKINMTASN